jgi:predicted alpha/beta-hydrolase family hydrolase
MAILAATPSEILLQPGTYDAIVAEVIVKERDGRTFLLWVFEVRYSDSKTTKVRRPTSMNFGPKSTARAIVEAVLRRKIRDGEQIDTDDLLGLRVRVVISRGTRRDGGETNRIEAVLPAPVEDEDDLLF